MLQLPRTPAYRQGSRKVRWGAFFLFAIGLGLGCQDEVSAQSQPEDRKNASQPAVTTKNASNETHLGVADVGVFSDLDERLQIALPGDLSVADVRAVWDPARALLVLYHEDWPVKIYPTKGSQSLTVGETKIGLRPGDRRELLPLLEGKRLERAGAGPGPGASDVDDDGIPDALDVLIGGHKTVLNGASYGGGYQKLAYPWGDMPREQGVCTDVVVRALRNAGVDIQSELQEDIKRKPGAFPMVKKRNPNIDHRRVKTLLPYFKRQYQAYSTSLEDASDPYRPGDIIFMDTFPRRAGPDHIGIISNTIGPSGLPLVINNWTNGSKTAELDLLTWVPVTHRFRLRDRHAPSGHTRQR